MHPTKKLLLLTTSLLLAGGLFAQTETFDIATFTPPSGWQRLDSNGILIFHDMKNEDGKNTFCQIVLYKSRKSMGSPSNDFEAGWKDYVIPLTKSTDKPGVQTEKSPEGWTVTTGAVTMNVQGGSVLCMLVNVSGFKKSFNVLINVSGANYNTDIQNFVTSLDLKAPPTSPDDNPAMASIGDYYSFILPEGWTQEKGNGFVRLIKKYISGDFCMITILTPQPSSGNLESDVRSVFGEVYKGWRYYYTDDRKDELQKGFTKQGLAWYSLEANMTRNIDLTSYDYQEGKATVIRTGKQIAIITIRHESTGINCECKKNYNTWGRFFNSFTVKNVTAQGSGEDISKKILGKWKMFESRAIGEYIFAANGHWQSGGAIGTSSTHQYSDKEITEYRSTSFEGDGTYTIKGDQLILNKKTRSKPDIYRLRVVQYKKGSSGWTDRIYMLDEQPLSGGNPYEVAYDKAPKE